MAAPSARRRHRRLHEARGRHAAREACTGAPVIAPFLSSPDGGRRLARDVRVRWAAAEVGQPHDARLTSFAALKEPARRALTLFGPIPTFEEDGVALFESSAIVLSIAERHRGLLPTKEPARAKAWTFAAVHTVAPPIFDRSVAGIVEGDGPWHVERKPMLEDRAHRRLRGRAAGLGGRDWLEGRFTARGRMMVRVPRRLRRSALLNERAALAAYIARRP